MRVLHGWKSITRTIFILMKLFIDCVKTHVRILRMIRNRNLKYTPPMRDVTEIDHERAGENVRAARRNNNLTLKWLAKKAHVSVATMSRMERTGPWTDMKYNWVMTKISDKGKSK